MNFAVAVFCVAMLARALNAASLSAMDVIVVEQADGTFVSSPFYVRVSNQNMMTGLEQLVTIKVNGEPVNVNMEIGSNGMAFFSHENEIDEHTDNLIVLPLPTEFIKAVENQSEPIVNSTVDAQKSNGTISRFSAWFTWRRFNSTKNSTEIVERVIDMSENSDDMIADYLNAINSNRKTSTTEAPITDAPIPDAPNTENSTTPTKKMYPSFRMSSEQIESLNLKSGVNEIEFSLGPNSCKSHVYRWSHTDKVVISDIDGTITKSDVLGHVMPIFGRDWTHDGIAELFTKIERNGYKFLYLSARAISHSSSTRDYLRKIQQGNETMPDGPVLLNPTSTMKAFHREVIKRQSELFKIESLNLIKSLFPENPFYAAYGNRINDEMAYDAVGISKSKIFLVNSKGELKNTLTESFQSTYQNMTDMVDHLYPPMFNDEDIYSDLKWLS